ncbi:putative lipoprotein [Fibrobacter succinogenes subsp. succinogenes S85]|uniref:Putative lipoprotein n=1 Tax=Fibrobacter succinogenes (strain ATCC 19169 / S85) TaxID=59374 RepID=C9RLG0_FIBSS|nr:hypothetical protein [Fibrobacter succinogenes]ACX74107.1 hypothetical protein Fisuc_0495 [Fibrobacter succinogenes subsp. succinogenes S85]ADL24892.1 putative lipoprotein [Fibrobacter succinogenes subsp. succinogenes S85]
MNNVIKFTMVASVLALMGCTDSNVSGAAIEDNAVAQNSSSSKANGSSNSMNGPSQIVFSTKATEVLNVDNADISVYGEENGAEAGCTADGKSFEAKLKVNDGLVENSIEMKNFGSSCDSVLAEFVASCQSRALVFNGSNNKESCDENGDVTAYCFDDRAVAMTKCTNNVPGTCSTKPAKTTIDFNELFKDFSKFSGEVCNAISKGASSTTGRFTTPSSTSRDMSSSSTEPPDPDTLNVIAIPRDTTPIDTAAFTLDKYTVQFTDDPSELSFDEHVLAYNGGLPSTAYLDEDIEQNRSGINPFLKEINVSDIGNYFPMTASIVGNRTPKENCKTFLVLSHDGAQPTGHVLSKISKGSIEISSVNPGGPCMQTAMYFPIAFLVEDCDGLLDENTELSYNRFTSKTWACETLGSPTKKARAYGEWYRADLAK